MADCPVHAAYDESLIESVPLVGEAEAMKRMETAVELFQDRSAWLSKPRRLQILEKTAAIIRQRRQELALMAAREGGKPLGDSLVEIDRAAEGVEVAGRELTQLAGQEIPMELSGSSQNRMAYTRQYPVGVVVAISAFNHPFNLIVHQVIPALAVGCPVLVKPAMTTPLSCLALVGILKEAGLPDGWVQAVPCENEVAQQLVTHRHTEFLTFIGSSKVGWQLRSLLPAGAHCALEHGGAAPVIVHDAASIEKIVQPLVKGGYYHAGQVCVSVQRIFVKNQLKDQLVEGMRAAAAQLKVGDPTDAGTEVGPLILPREVDRVAEWVKEAVDGGARLVCGGERLSKTCYQPTLLVDTPTDCRLARQEVFGPVVCINGFDDLDSAIAAANGVDYAFQAAVFSDSWPVIERCVDGLEAAAVMVNDHTAFRVDWMPFGGYKSSGLGMGGIGHTMRDLCREKMFVLPRGDRC